MRNWLRCFRLLLSCLLLFGSISSAYALTWNEPWHEQVVKESDHFVLASVLNTDEKTATISIINTLGGSPLTGSIKLTDFYLLDLCSTSGGHGPEFQLTTSDTAYFFVKRNKEGDYSLATPTTGYATVKGTRVAATYRHSYHRALVDRSTYELTMTAIFQHYHGQPYDAKAIRSFVGLQLSKKPATINEAGMLTFFRQHAALETIYHLGLTDFYTATLPFLKDSKNFHAQISAARALAPLNTPEANQQLLTLISDAKADNFSKVVAVWSLAGHKPVSMKATLQKLSKNASQEENGFGGNIMDPRVCTHFPSVKEALTKLVAGL